MVLGAELIPFSPLNDKSLPESIDGIIIGGGYPELYTDKLSNNTSMLETINNAYNSNMPIYAEGGGYMYLGSTIEGKDMINIFDHKSELTSRLQNFGYIKLVANKDNMLCKKEESINGHEFHYNKSDFDGMILLQLKNLQEKKEDV